MTPEQRKDSPRRRTRNPKYKMTSFGAYDLVGNVFGKLTVLSLSPIRYKAPRGKPQRQWVCLCECGNTSTVTSNNLAMGHQISCGCSGRHPTAEIIKKRALGIVKVDTGLKETYRSYKSNANKRGIQFELTLEDARDLFSKDCHYCGRKPSSMYIKSYYPFIYNGIDRKINSLGYLKENCVTCCGICNRSKVDLDYDVFLHMIEVIYNRLINK